MWPFFLLRFSACAEGEAECCCASSQNRSCDANARASVLCYCYLQHGCMDYVPEHVFEDHEFPLQVLFRSLCRPSCITMAEKLTSSPVYREWEKRASLALPVDCS